MSAGEPRTLAPPARRVAPVVGAEEIGAYRLLWAEDRHGPPDPRPGQFYMLAAARRWGGGVGERPYLPRAFSYARAQRLEEGVRLCFLLEEVGPGTGRLAELGPGDGLALLGPLGVGFRPVRGGRRALLVGGGIGVAPLLCAADELQEASAGQASGGSGGVSPRSLSILLGFRTGAHGAAASLFPRPPALASEDGSAGRRGLVTELLREELDRDPEAEVLACGPPAMLEAVRSLCAERDVWAQLAMEAGMACGFGACFGCVVPTRQGYLRLCVDGPVVEAERLETALAPGGGHQG